MSTHEDSEKRRWVDAAVSKYEGVLVRYATQITGDLDRGRDVAQDTFLRLCRQDRQKIDGHLAEWLYTVCRNRALDVRRKEDRMKTITDQQAAAQPSRETEQDAVIERRETADLILKFVDGLTDNQREVVRLKFQNGLSYKEIAAVTQLSASNVGYLIHTAIHRLRQELGVDCV